LVPEQLGELASSEPKVAVLLMPWNKTWLLRVSALSTAAPPAFWIWKAVVELAWFWNKADPPSAKLNTVVLLSWNLAMLPVEVELLTLKVSAEPEVRFVTVVGP
jgi:hypothetical protein